MIELSPYEIGIISDHPIDGALKPIQRAFRKSCDKLRIARSSESAERVLTSEDDRTLVRRLIVTLQGQEAAQVLPSKISDKTLSEDLAAHYSEVGSNGFNLQWTIPLCKLVVDHASDESIWKAVFDSIANAQPPPAFPFLRLPLEIRTMIYWRALAAPKGFVKAYADEKVDSDYKIGAYGLAIANRQVWSETRPCLYGVNEISFDQPKNLKRFLSSIGNRNKNLVVILSILPVSPFETDEWATLLEDPKLTALRCVKLFGQPRNVWDNVLRGIRLRPKPHFDGPIEVAVQRLLTQNQYPQLGPTELIVVGFHHDQEQERKYPSEWRITFEQYDFDDDGYEDTFERDLGV